MNLPLFDQTRENELSSYGEAVRLSNELRAKPEKTFDIIRGTVVESSKWGFDCETAEYSDFSKWLNDATIKKSQSLFWFVIRIMAWRFPEKHTEIRNNLADRRKLEFDLILSQMKKEFEWVGTVGYSNLVRLDKSLNNPGVKVLKLNNDRFQIKKF